MTQPSEPPDRVLVTGAGGGIGRALLHLLAARGIACTALDLAFARAPEADRAVTGDCTAEAVVQDALDGCDAVIHLAAIPAPHHAPARVVYSTNVVSTFTVLSLAGESGITRTAIASSINATGVPFNTHDVHQPYFPLDEQLPPQLDDWYSLSKYQDELTAGMAASRWGMSVVCLRLPLTTDPDTLRAYASRAAADPAATARHGWSYLLADDAAEAFLAAIQPRPAGAVVAFVAAPDTLLPWPTEAALARWAPEVRIRRRMPGHSSTVDSSVAAEELGFRAQRSLDVGRVEHLPAS